MKNSEDQKTTHERFIERLREPLVPIVVDRGIMTDEEKEKNDRFEEEVIKLAEKLFGK